MIDLIFKIKIRRKHGGRLKRNNSKRGKLDTLGGKRLAITPNLMLTLIQKVRT